MKRTIGMLAGALLAAFITACGGGGGSPGNVPNGPPPAEPTVTVDLVDAQGSPTNTITSASTVYARATAKSASGTAMAGEVVTFTGDGKVRFAPASGTALTGSNGIAMVQVFPMSAASAGAGTLKAEATLAGKAVSGTVAFQIPTGSSDEQTSKVANFVMLLDKSTLPNGGTATVKLTVVAVDAANNVVPGAAVSVSTDANTMFIPGSTATDASGQFTGTISMGADKSDRTVTVTGRINNITKMTTFQIAGSQLTVTTNPSVLSPGGAAVLTVRLVDSASQPIAGQAIALSGDIATVAGRTVTTGPNGTASLNFTAPATAGNYVVIASGSGIVVQTSFQVGTSAAIPAAVIPSGVQPSLSVLPSVVSPNTEGSSTNQSQLRLLFLDANNQPVPNVRVRFDITSTGLGSFDSRISSGSSTVYTNASGVATASFIPGPTGSPTDGVVIRACYKATEFTSTAECPASVQARLTITQQALAVSIGNDNLINKGPGTYIKQLTVTVADAAGRAVPNAAVDISLDITHYGKGWFDQTTTFSLNVAESNSYNPPDPTIRPADYGRRVACINEDFNRNGFADPGENVNGSVDSFGQPTLEPRKSDIIISYVDPAVRTTNSSGILLIQVEYSQRFATWLAYRVRATTTVSGSQGSAERAFVTTYAEDDQENGSFWVPPYGTGACTEPN
jgi:hypothetical protein